MAGPYVPVDLRSYEVVLSTFNEKVQRSIAAVLQKTVKECYEEIVRTSPYLTGSYISSHRIGVNNVDGSDTVYTIKNPISESVARTNALKELEKLENLKADDTIYISNSVGFSNSNHYSWAANVEYAGWESGTGKREPYLVFEKAALLALNRIPEYAVYVKSQGDKILDTAIM